VKSLLSDLKGDQWRRVRFDGVMDSGDQSDARKCDEVWTVGSESWQGMDVLICNGPILRWSMKRRPKIEEYKGVALPRKALSRTRPQFYYVTFRIAVRKAQNKRSVDNNSEGRSISGKIRLKKHGKAEKRDHGSKNQMQASRRSSGILQK